MPTSSNKALIQTLTGQVPHRTPVWFLRQAGRYLPEYRSIRKEIGFVELCTNPELAAEVTLQPLRRFDLDAAIIFSDILMPLISMGQNLSFDKGHGPVLTPPVRTQNDVDRLIHPPHPEHDFSFISKSLQLTKKNLAPHQSLIGFAGAPFTVASYAIEGQSSKTFFEIKSLAFQQPKVFANLLQKISDVTYDYLKVQVDAGADALMLFDSWAANLSFDALQKHVYPITAQLFERIKTFGVPLIYYPGQSESSLRALGAVNCNALAIDWRMNLGHIPKILDEISAKAQVVQGNLDPIFLSCNQATVNEQVLRVLELGKKHFPNRYIFNVGHGLLPTTNPDAISCALGKIRASSDG